MNREHNTDQTNPRIVQRRSSGAYKKGKRSFADQRKLLSSWNLQFNQWITCDSILQELTVAALELFRDGKSFNAFLGRMAGRLGCFSIVALDLSLDQTEFSIFASAGLSRKSRDMILTPENVRSCQFPWPEVHREDVVVWCVDLSTIIQDLPKDMHYLILFRSSQEKISDFYFGLVQRIMRIFCRARDHHWLKAKKKEQTQMLNEHKERFRGMCNDMLIGIIFISNDGSVFCNKRVQMFFRVEQEGESITSILMKIFQASVNPKILMEKMLTRYQSDQANLSVDVAQDLDDGIHELTMKNGNQLQYMHRPVIDSIGRNMGWCWYFNELVDDADTTRKFAVALETEQRTRMLIESKNKQMSFLAEAGKLLVSIKDSTELLKACIRLCVPYIADSVAFEFISPTVNGRLLVAGRRRTNESEDGVCHLIYGDEEAHVPVDLNAPSGPGHVAATGISELWPTIGMGDIRHFSSNPKFNAFMNRLEPVSALYVPLIARDKCMGVMSWARLKPTMISFNEEDRILAEDFANRIALAIDNARLLQEAEDAVAIRNEFFAVASHELRTPVTSCRLATQGVQRLIHRNADRLGDDLVTTLDESMKVALRQSDRLDRFVSKFSMISTFKARYSDLVLERFSLSETVSLIVLDLSGEFKTAGCEPVLDIETTEGVWDRFAIDRMVTNLITNALKFGSGYPVSVSVWNEGGWAFVRVADKGIGIHEEDRERIFGRFIRGISVNNYGGFGIGLSVISELTGRMGGYIYLDSIVGQGTTFIIALPLVVETVKTTDDCMAVLVSKKNLLHLDSTGILSGILVPSAVRSAFERGHKQK